MIGSIPHSPTCERLEYDDYALTTLDPPLCGTLAATLVPLSLTAASMISAAGNRISICGTAKESVDIDRKGRRRRIGRLVDAKNTGMDPARRLHEDECMRSWRRKRRRAQGGIG